MYGTNLHDKNYKWTKCKDVWSLNVGFEKYNNPSFSKLVFVSDIY